MSGDHWFILFGLLFLLMGLVSSAVKRLPLTTALLYLIVGLVLGPEVTGLFYLDPIENSALLERVTEVLVVLSLFVAGLKLRLRWQDPRWKIALRLGFLSMTLTVGMIAFVGVVFLGLPLGAAVLLGAILAPTDPVLASDIQVKDSSDQERTRFSLTGEAGFNDGTAFPFVMLGLGLLGEHELGVFGIRWLLVDVLWAIPGGLLIGALFGTAIGRFVMWRRKSDEKSAILDDFIALGLMGTAYGVALLAETYGFLAAFSAGLALRRVERTTTDEKASEQRSILMTGVVQNRENPPAGGAAYTAQAILFFNEQLERIGEVIVVVLIGGMIWFSPTELRQLWFAPLLFFGVRPIAVLLGLWRSEVTVPQRRLIAWFGIRGVGSLYYLTYAIEHGLSGDLAVRLTTLTLLVVASSIIVHGISVTPIMAHYLRRRQGGE